MIFLGLKLDRALIPPSGSLPGADNVNASRERAESESSGESVVVRRFAPVSGFEKAHNGEVSLAP